TGRGRSRAMEGWGEEAAVSWDGDAGGDHVLPQRDGPGGFIDRQGDAEQRQAKQQSRRDRHDDKSRVYQPGGAKMDAAIDEIERAIEHVWPWHQDHAWADRNQAQGRAELVANRQRADRTGDKRRAEWLEEYVCAIAGYGATQNSAGSGTPEEHPGRARGPAAEVSRQGHGPRRGREREKPCRSGWRPCDSR